MNRTRDYSKRQELFPRCNLHGTRIVDRFPEGCPLSRAVAMEGIAEMQDQAWAKIGQLPFPDWSGLRDLEVMKICEACCCEKLSNPVIKDLRRRMAADSSSHNMTETPAPVTPKVSELPDAEPVDLVSMVRGVANKKRRARR